ncbi:N-fatty-acyl-amino acid synthase/hydrolase PM20D1.2-like [Littorina saxatilis]|uniref:Peptidase M20 dimerisation domain-containing protein n=1 Tax=Littorina saxatilis TaxID=31220 RepID=A0AAN9BAM1_9CAEN
MSRARVLGLLLLAISPITFVVLVRTFTVQFRTDAVRKCSSSDADFIPLTEKRLENFRQALRFRTVSRDQHDYNREELARLGKFIVQAYPTIHSSPLVKHEFVANLSLLYTVKGSDAILTPYLLASHLDVVPADANQWEADPFAADIINDFIYARGTIDVKQGVMGILEALEFLLSNGFQPRRTFYVAFGHDEEVAGLDGAYNLAETLRLRGVKKLEFVSDEGLTVLNQIVPGIAKPVAAIGTSEKGQVILRLKVKGQTGHSSMPIKDSSIGILARAVHRLESNPHPSMFGYGPERAMFEHLAADMQFSHRMIMSNLWLFSPLISWVLSQKPSTNAVVRTVTAVTKFNAGIKDNVIPPEAEAIVNHRIHPAQSVQEVIDYDRYIIDDDRVTLEVKSSMEPHPLSPHGDEDFGYQVMKNSIRQVWIEAAVAPGVMIGNTDTRHYLQFTHNVYRFSPTFMFPDDLPRFHGINERISKKNYEQAINFYHHLILNADEPALPPLHKHSSEL